MVCLRRRSKLNGLNFPNKPTGEGTGLSLSLSYDLITEGHGGSLTGESQEGQSSAFMVYLPNPAGKDMLN